MMGSQSALSNSFVSHGTADARNFATLPFEARPLSEKVKGFVCEGEASLQHSEYTDCDYVGLFLALLTYR